MSTISVFLMGGLGNQMFQYAIGRALALKYGKELVLDTATGFARDRQYKRVFELHSFAVKAKSANFGQRLPFWAYHIEKKLGFTGNSTVHKSLLWEYVVEQKASYLPDFEKISPSKHQWLFGYWQSPKYFEEQTELILQELTPPESHESKYQRVADKVRSEESVALGIRLYEESADPAFHAKDRRLKTPKDLNAAIRRLLLNKPSAKFFVFSTVKSSLFDKLELPSNTEFILSANGYNSTIDTLWLLTQCKHHIFTNSSFYWWGAWLSQANHARETQQIFAADNFINSDSYCKNWHLF